MSIPKRHHYLPQSYLEAWARNDGEVTQYYRPWRDLIVKPCSPYSTGFVDGLYSLHGEPDPERREQVELRWLQRIDNDAAIILKQLKAEPKRRVDPAQSEAWSMFLISMIFRTPARLAWMHEEMRRFHSDFDDAERAEYAKCRGPEDPDSPEQYFRQAGYEELSWARMQLMLNMIQSRLIGGGLARMAWTVHALERVRYGLLTCDDPVIMSNGLNAADSFVMLPLGPFHLFVAGGSSRALWSYTSQSDRDIERAINDAIVAQADAIVIGRNDQQASFIDRRLGRSPANDGFLGRHTWKCP